MLTKKAFGGNVDLGIDEKQKNLYKNTLITATIITFIALLLITAYAIKTKNNDICGAKTESLHTTQIFVDSIRLNHTGDYALQQNKALDEGIKNYFCHESEANTTSTVSVAVINEHETVLGLGWLNNQTTSYCHEIKYEETETNQYLGLKCLDCDSNDYVDLQKQFSGATNTLVISEIDNTTANAVQQPLSYSTKNLYGCRETIKKIIDLYLILMAGIFLIIMIMVGYKGFKNMLFKDW